MAENNKSKGMVIIYLLLIIGIGSFLAYNGGYMIGKFKAHIENNK